MTIPSNAYAHSETALEADYLAMSQNLEREREAVEWIEWIDGLILDTDSPENSSL